MKKYLFLSFILSLLSLTSCYENKIETAEKAIFNKPTENVRVYTKAETNYIAETVTGTTVDFSSSTPDDILPKKGEIIQMPISERTPNGFLGKVTSVEKEGSVITVTTEQVALDEAYPNLSIDTTFNFMDMIDGVYDEDGNPVEYEIVTLDSSEEARNTRAGGTAEAEEWDGKKVVRVKVDSKWGDFSAGGYISFGFGMGQFSIDNKDGLKYLNIEANPYIDANVQVKATIKDFGKNIQPKRSKRVRFTFRLTAGPVIIPITVYGNFVVGAKGEITSTITLQYQKSQHCYVKYANGKWSKGVESTGRFDGNPWYIQEFDFNGELYAGAECGVIFGLYSATSGVGVNLLPKISLEAEANYNIIDPFKLNPQVSIAGKLESSIFVIAELFGWELAKWQLDLPEYTFFNQTLSLFPNISNFDATGGSSAAEISYQSDSYYLLQALNLVKTGATVFQDDQTTEVKTLYPASKKTDRYGVRYYNTNVTGLRAGTTYYAAPVISFLDHKWYGEKQEFFTEAKYNLGFRCSNHDYDVISFSFDLNNKSENVIDYTTEAADYDGSPMRVHITASYNAYNKTLNGLFDFYFYNSPEQKRKDGFTVSLANDDSGYVDCDKVIDNGGCYAALRIYKDNSAAARAVYDKPLVEDDCNVGLFNKNMKK